MSSRYPKIHIRSKRELARHISGPRLSPDKALELINHVQENFDTYWHDHPTRSEPDNKKWVRDASRSDLGRLLKLIDSKILKPYDKLLPDYIFGGVSGKNHKAAAQQLLGRKRSRIMLKLDITKFFEQNRYDRVYHFFLSKSECSRKGAKLIADFCCVPYGPKDRPYSYKTIARGFPTSPRLAVWCNLDTFIKIERLVKEELRGKDPRIAIYVDDIGITASKATKEDLMLLYPKVKAILDADKNQKLPLNDSKTKIINHSGDTFDINGEFIAKRGFEILGLQMNRNKLTLGTKTRWKLVGLTQRYKESRRKDKKIRKSRKSTLRYKDYIERN